MVKKQVKNVFKLRISLSGLCNYRCIFCHNEGRQEYSKAFLSNEEVLLLCAGAWQAGIRIFTFTGGEPLTHPKAFDIIANVRKKFPYATLKLTTNAVLLSQNDLPFLCNNIDKIRINFQSTNPLNFQKLVGVNKYSHLISIIKDIMKTKIHICLNYVFTNESKEEISHIVKFAYTNKLEMKVLELIKNINNSKYYEPISNAKDYLENISYKTEKDYQDDDLYYLSGNKAKIRLCYAHCNSENGKSCRKLGELRTSPDMDIYPCMHPETPKINVKGITQSRNIYEAILEMDKLKGICPKRRKNEKTTHQLQCASH